MDISDDTDNFRRFISTLLQALHVNDSFLAEGINSVEIFVHKNLVHDGHVLFFGQFLLAEETAGAQRNVHGAQIVRTDNADIGNGKVHERLLRLAKNMYAGGGTQPGERRKTFHAGGAHAGDDAKAGEKLLEESQAQRVGTVFGGGKRDLEGQEMAGIKSGINANQTDEATHEQAGADEQDQSQAQLSYDESIACEGAATGGRGTAASFLESFRDARMRGDVGRQKAEEQTGEKSGCNRSAGNDWRDIENYRAATLSRRRRHSWAGYARSDVRRHDGRRTPRRLRSETA